MNLGLHHELLLLDLGPDGCTRSSGATRTFGLCGAVVTELELRDRLKVGGADRFGIASGAFSPGALGLAERALSGRLRSRAGCLQRLRFAFPASPVVRIRAAALEELVRQGALTPRSDTFLALPWRTRHVPTGEEFVSGVVQRLRAYVEEVPSSAAPSRDDLLVSLLRGMNLLRVVWSDEELATWKPRIDERTERAPIGKLVRDLAREETMT